MVRTRDSAGTKAVGAKAPRKVSGAGSGSGSNSFAGASVSDSAKNKYSGGNAYFPRETPAWQKPITAFFSNEEGEEPATRGRLIESVSTVDKEKGPEPGDRDDNCTASNE